MNNFVFSNTDILTKAQLATWGYTVPFAAKEIMEAITYIAQTLGDIKLSQEIYGAVVAYDIKEIAAQQNENGNKICFIGNKSKQTQIDNLISRESIVFDVSKHCCYQTTSYFVPVQSDVLLYID